MTYQTLIAVPARIGVICCAVFVSLPVGCIVEQPPPREYAARPPLAPVIVEDDFVYYPGYEAYYSTNRHVFYYREGGAWVIRPSLPGVELGVLLASPSVHMDFHDSPERHHAEIVGRYPRDWRGGERR